MVGKFQFFVDTEKEEKRIIKKTKAAAERSHKRFVKKGFGVSKIRRKFF